MTNTAVVLVADWFPGGEMAVEQWHIDYIFIDLRGRHFRGLNREFVSRRRASLDPGTDIRKQKIRADIFFAPPF